MQDGLSAHPTEVESRATKVEGRLEVFEKPWFRSRAIVAVLVAVAAQIAQRAGLPGIDPNDEELVNIALDLLSGVAAAVALLGRYRATTQIQPLSKTANRAARGIVALLVMALIALALSGCLVTGSVLYPLPEGGSASVGFTGELPRTEGFAK